MDGRISRRANLLVALLLTVTVVGSVAVTPAAAQANGSSQPFIVKQGGKCIQVSPLGNGTETAYQFYDYRSPLTDPEGYYSSYGTRDIQESQVSQFFVYNGSDGLSLVFLNDKFGDGHGGFVVTGNISGLPTDGAWTVEDDTYNHQDDVFDTNESNGSAANIQWFSNGNRTDGAAFTGLESPNYSAITVRMRFNKQSGNFPYEKWDSPPAENHIRHWVVRSGDGRTTELDMNESVQISPGTCSGGVSTFTATPNATTGANGTTGAPTASTAMGTATTGGAMTTATQTTMATATRTATQTPTATPTAGADTAASTTDTAGTTSGAGTTTASGSGTAGGGSATNASANDSNDAGGSGAFGPGFGVGIAVVAVAALAAVALARRKRLSRFQ